MATEIIMPKNGMDMQEGTLIKWLKNVGDKVEMDEPIMEIETDKVTMESESPAAGILLAKYYEDGAVIPVLKIMGYIGQAGEQVPDAPGGATAPAAAPQTAAAPAAAVAAPAAVSANGEYAATPFAKHLAQEKGIPLSAVTPSGPHGEIKGRDVEDAKAVKATPLAANVAADLGVSLAGVQGTGFNGKVTRDDVVASQAPVRPSAPAPHPGPAAPFTEELRHYPMNGMRKAVAKKMSLSHTEIPPVTQNIETDVTSLLEIRTQLNDGQPKERKVSVNDLVLRAVAIAVSEKERFRMRLADEKTFESTNAVHIGMAVGLDEGLIVPVIPHADQLDVFQISAKAKELADKARKGKLSTEEYGYSVFSVSNMGMYNFHSFTPIINQPEGAILGVNAAIDRLALENGNIVVKKIMMLSLTYDHRIINGTEAADFQLRVKFLLEHPALLLLPPQA